HEHPDTAPAGANDFSCTPAPDHPEPVVLAHGTDASADADWAALSPMLAADGYCLFALNYGGAPGADSYGTADN
ncbi:lipase, partial [Rhodococcus sp. IEGM 1351]|nr:lipase [Rhodococcus sp. IEGM 1351]